jgi:tetratricopeptide (TPR) repeat protein
MAGVGKTALAVHAAHRLSDRYPDAQLFVNLRGHSADSPAMDATAALDTLLRALDVPGERIPADLDGRSALWRAKLAERRAVVVLDDAADAAQVRPLLPGTAHSLALVTSRRQLVDLDAARTVSLDVLPHADAVELFRRIVDDERVSAEPDAVDEAVRLCGYLPLAIRIAAARLRSRPTWTVRHLVRRLTEGRPLAELTAGERSVGAAFTVSYQQLTPPQRRLFGLLGLHPGADFDACSAAALAALAVPAADRLLEELLDVHLVHQVTAGRYRFHDLVRQHARDSGHRDEPEGERWCAVTRLLDHYLHTSYAGDRWLYPHRPTITLGAPADGCAVRPLDGDQAALDWFDGEYAGLLAAQRLATEQRRHDYVWRLAWTLTGYRRRRGHFRDSLDAWSLGLAAAQRLGDPVAEVQARRYLGYAHTLQGDHPEALRHLHRALALTEDLGDTANRGHTHYTLAKVRAAQGDQERALAEATRALELFEGLDNPVWLADALNTVGWYHACLGHFAEAESCCSAALALHRQQGDLSGEAHTLDSLGYVAYRAGRYAQALDRYRDALRVRRRIGATSDEADTLAQLGEIHAALGDHPGARGAWQQALDLYREQHRADDAERMRHRLAAPDPSLV